MSLLPVGFGASDDGYTIDDSLRFRSSASAALYRTFGTPTDNNKWTYSVWVKRGSLAGGYNTLFGRYVGGTNFIRADFLSDKFRIYQYVGGIQILVETAALFRDPSAWYHLTVVLDTSNSTSTDRVIFYVNGVRVTSFSSTTYPSLNLASVYNVSGGVVHRIGALTTGDFDGYLTEVNFIDGQALAPTDFGEFDDNGTWKPLAYTGTYGTNGFYIDATTSGTAVLDQSGNSNNWSSTNMNLTTSTATTYDLMKDTPSLVDENAGNFATLNPLDKGSQVTLSSGNLDVSWSNVTGHSVRSTLSVSSGKWYAEYTMGSSRASVGIAKPNNNAVGASWIGSSAYGSGGSYGYGPNGLSYTNGSGSTYGASWVTGDVIGIAFDADAGTITFYKNGVSQGQAYSGISGEFAFGVGYFGSPTGGTSGNINFGQRPFAYTPPTGFLKLNTFNLPDSTIEDGSDYFETLTYTGTGTSTSKTLEFQPDLVWFKGRNASSQHLFMDSVRGNTKYNYITTAAEQTDGTNVLTSFNSDGYTLPNDTGGYANYSGRTYANWNWKAGGTAVSNSDGTLSATVSANTTSGFSIVSYTGNGSNSTVGHGLNTAPEVVIVKDRDRAVSWPIMFKAANNGNGQNGWILLDLTAAWATTSILWNNTAPTSSVFSIGTYDYVNFNNSKYIAYCFAPVEGYSAFGSYTGNGSTDGPFVYTGFRPAWVLLKKTTATSNWSILDTTRDTYNVSDSVLLPNSANAEVTSSTSANAHADLLSNGFKARGNSGDINDSGATYIYMAFAENPFKNALAR